MTPIKSIQELQNPAVVKVLADQKNKAIYFSRYPVPYTRETPPVGGTFASQRHIGLYVFRRKTLFEYQNLPSSTFETGESLEQLRAIQAGWLIGIKEVKSNSIGVDTPEDLIKANEIAKGFKPQNYLKMRSN